MDTTAFYATTAAACFTLLGFWWVIVEFRHAALTREAGPRRFAFVVSLQFVLPGLASLASLLASGPVWRVVFAAMAVTGSAAAVLGVRALGGTLVALRALALASLPLYLGAGVIAAVPSSLKDAGIDPIAVEGLVLVLVLLLGVVLAWQVFTDPALRARDEAA